MQFFGKVFFNIFHLHDLLQFNFFLYQLTHEICFVNSFHPRGSCHAWHSLPFQPGLPFSPVGPSAPLLAAPEKRSCWQGPHTDACLPVSLPPSSWSRTITCPGPVAAAAPVRGLIPRPACQQPPRSARGSLQPLPARGSRPCPQPSSPSRPGSPPGLPRPGSCPRPLSPGLL